MTFMFTSNSYAMGILFAPMAAAWLLTRLRYVGLGAIPLMVFSMGIYQSYICLTAGILVLKLLLDLIDQSTVKASIQRGILYLISMGASMLYTD